MAINDNIKFRFIQNIGDYFPTGYFGEDFLEKVQKQVGMSSEGLKQLCAPFPKLRQVYDAYKNDIVTNRPRIKDAIKYTHDFHTSLLEVLGYDVEHTYDAPFVINQEANEVIPVRHVLTHNGKVRMLIMEMQHLIKLDDEEPAGLFDQQYDSSDDDTIASQRYRTSQWERVFNFGEACKISPSIINKAVTSLFLLPENRPHFILMLAGNTVFLFDADKWSRGSYLQFSLDDLFSQASVSTYRLYYALFYLLVCKDTLAADSETVLMDALIEDSYKNAYEVTKDLKEGVVCAIETLANEAVYYKHQVLGELFDETDDTFESEVKDDCLTIVYRLLFIFYAESRSDLGILPTNDEVYNKGYSLEMLRDLEQIRLISEESRNGYFFDETLQKLFGLLGTGFNSTKSDDKSFVVRKIDSPLFDNNRLKHLGNIKVRNAAWQQIIKSLSLSKKNGYCGRISYANLGVNQLGSVYESLLAYRGFYAEEDYIEVQDPAHTDKGQFLVPYSRMKDFDIAEVIKEEDGSIRRLKKGTFVYRLNGRDRQKSASYYTPEVLTRSTVKYTLKSILDEVEAGTRKPVELLELKILEPAMGAAAFQNEVINQLAEAYLTYQQKYLNRRVDPDRYRDELQKVKAYIATHNVYGVDLNPTAIELGKLSLWLNVMHKDMQTPFFSNRLAVGNAVVGAWLKVYSKNEVLGTIVKKKLVQNPWWEKAPHKVKFFANRVNRSTNEIYHFLLPDKNMLGVLTLSDQKKEYPTEAKRMKAIKDDWIKPINSYEFERLQKLSAKIDVLLKEYFTFQTSIENITKNRMQLWGVGGEYNDTLFEDYSTKERLNDTRYRHDNAYFRLRTVMDYWCSLWFWEYDEAHSLPTREDYWADIDAILDVDDAKLNKKNLQTAKVTTTTDTQTDLFLPPQTPEEAIEEQQTEAESAIIVQSKEEILAAIQGSNKLFDDSQRVRIVIEKAKRYYFFHPMLEFLEVFWLRDGFDIICGNPPWIKWVYEPQVIVGDKYPQYIIREEYNADTVERLLQSSNYLNDPQLRAMCERDMIEVNCMSELFNAPVLYKNLKGNQSDLFKNILNNSLEWISDNGFIGMVHPNTVFDEAKGQTFREFVYPRLRYVFQYENRLKLFSEVEAKKPFDISVYGNAKSDIDFVALSSIYHPNMIDASFAHSGSGYCHGSEIVDEEGKKTLNLEGHRDRIVHYDRAMLELIGQVFEGTNRWQSCKLVSIHSQRALEIVEKLSDCDHLSSCEPLISEGYHATNSLKDNTIKKETKCPDYEEYEMMFNSTQVGILSPFSKMPQAICNKDSQYDAVDYVLLDIQETIRTNYLPKAQIIDFKNCIDPSGVWFTRYKMAFKKMLDVTHERTLKGGLLPPKSSHTHSLISASFKNTEDLLLFAGLSSSVILDFFLKTVRCGNLTKSVMDGLPFGVAEKYKTAIEARVLRMNCVNIWYTDLWEVSFSDEITHELWSQPDHRLSPFSNLKNEFTSNVLLRNDFERRMALIELDVIVAQALGLTFDDLMFIYISTFSTSQKYDADTWFDQNGRIVFTVAKGSPIKRDVWETIRNKKKGEIFECVIENSELNRGKRVTYYAPFERCDRVEDYKRAWKHFEDRFKERQP